MAVQFAAGKAEMRVDNLPVRDYHNAATALGKNTFATGFDPAVVSFDVVWSGPITRRVDVGDGTLGNHYAGEYVENQVTVTWSGTNLAEGFTFTADPGTFATSAADGGFAELGHERNGIFAGPGDDGDAELARHLLVATPAGKDQGVQAGSPPGRLAVVTASPPPFDPLKAQAVQPAVVPAWLSAGAAQHRALDQVFAQADGDTLRADDVPAWAV